MKNRKTLNVLAGMTMLAAAGLMLLANGQSSQEEGAIETASSVEASSVEVASAEMPIVDDQIALCQGIQCGCQTGNCGCGAAVQAGFQGGGFQGNFHGGLQPGFQGGPQAGFQGGPAIGRTFSAVDESHRGRFGGEAKWRQQSQVPWEAFAYGEYVGPHRTPHVPEYRLRVDDSLEFVYMLTREKSHAPYQFYVGDVIQISSTIDPSLNTPLGQGMTILPDGTLSLSLIGQVRAAGKTVAELQDELNDKYTKFVKNPAIVVQVLESDTPLQDLIRAVDATAGQGGQLRQATVSPDGTVQLPLVGSVPAVGLTLDEIRREVNARYRTRLRGVEVTPILLERAPRFIYVVGEVDNPGSFEMTGPTTVIQALALAGSFDEGSNLRQVIVFRRDQNWRLTATKLDLSGALLGKRPHPSDEIWLRDSDIVLVPETPVQRWSEAVNQYLTNSLYAIFPQQGVAFDFDDFTSF